jgi:hypothetical protein
MKQLIDDIIEGLARFGCGMAGLPYPNYPSPP